MFPATIVWFQISRRNFFKNFFTFGFTLLIKLEGLLKFIFQRNSPSPVVSYYLSLQFLYNCPWLEARRGATSIVKKKVSTLSLSPTYLVLTDLTLALKIVQVRMLRKIPSLSSMQQMMRPVSSTSSTSSLNQLGKQSTGTLQRVPSEQKSFGFAAEVKKTHCEKVERQFIGFFG